ncbi:hypothetical protein ACHAWF_008662 [Thalassiosira exigua]
MTPPPRTLQLLRRAASLASAPIPPRCRAHSSSSHAGAPARVPPPGPRPRRAVTTTTATTAAGASLLRRSARRRSLATKSSPSPSSHPFVLSHPSDVDGDDDEQDSNSNSRPSRGRIVCITSGKGGVGKTTSAASFATGLALRGRSTCAVDFDVGLRNLDIHLGCERRVVFDWVHVMRQECGLDQALIPDKRTPGLSVLAASQTRDKDALTMEGVEGVLSQLAERFEYVILDSPAGIESGARHAMYFCDDAIVTTNPELSSCRDADKMIGFVSSKSRRAEVGTTGGGGGGGGCRPVSQTLLVTRYDPVRAAAEESLSVSDLEELLGLPVLGVVPESRDVLTCTNLGKPVISMGEDHPAAGAYMDAVDRFLGEERELRFVTPEPVGFFKRFFG